MAFTAEQLAFISEIQNLKKSFDESTELSAKASYAKQILQLAEVNQNLSEKLIKKQYQKLILIYHPDKFTGSESSTDRENAHEPFLIISEIYDYLNQNLEKIKKIRQVATTVEDSASRQRAEVRLKKIEEARAHQYSEDIKEAAGVYDTDAEPDYVFRRVLDSDYQTLSFAEFFKDLINGLEDDISKMPQGKRVLYIPIIKIIRDITQLLDCLPKTKLGYLTALPKLSYYSLRFSFNYLSLTDIKKAFQNRSILDAFTREIRLFITTIDILVSFYGTEFLLKYGEILKNLTIHIDTLVADNINISLGTILGYIKNYIVINIKEYSGVDFNRLMRSLGDAFSRVLHSTGYGSIRFEKYKLIFSTRDLIKPYESDAGLTSPYHCLRLREPDMAAEFLIRTIKVGANTQTVREHVLFHCKLTKDKNPVLTLIDELGNVVLQEQKPDHLKKKDCKFKTVRLTDLYTLFPILDTNKINFADLLEQIKTITANPDVKLVDCNIKILPSCIYNLYSKDAIHSLQNFVAGPFETRLFLRCVEFFNIHISNPGFGKFLMRELERSIKPLTLDLLNFIKSTFGFALRATVNHTRVNQEDLNLRPEVQQDLTRAQAAAIPTTDLDYISFTEINIQPLLEFVQYTLITILSNNSLDEYLAHKANLSKSVRDSLEGFRERNKVLIARIRSEFSRKTEIVAYSFNTTSKAFSEASRALTIRIAQFLSDNTDVGETIRQLWLVMRSPGAAISMLVTFRRSRDKQSLLKSLHLLHHMRLLEILDGFYKTKVLHLLRFTRSVFDTSRDPHDWRVSARQMPDINTIISELPRVNSARILLLINNEISKILAIDLSALSIEEKRNYAAQLVAKRRAYIKIAHQYHFFKNFNHKNIAIPVAAREAIEQFRNESIENIYKYFDNINSTFQALGLLKQKNTIIDQIFGRDDVFDLKVNQDEAGPTLAENYLELKKLFNECINICPYPNSLVTIGQLVDFNNKLDCIYKFISQYKIIAQAIEAHQEKVSRYTQWYYAFSFRRECLDARAQENFKNLLLCYTADKYQPLADFIGPDAKQLFDNNLALLDAKIGEINKSIQQEEEHLSRIAQSEHKKTRPIIKYFKIGCIIGAIVISGSCLVYLSFQIGAIVISANLYLLKLVVSLPFYGLSILLNSLVGLLSLVGSCALSIMSASMMLLSYVSSTLATIVNYEAHRNIILATGALTGVGLGMFTVYNFRNKDTHNPEPEVEPDDAAGSRRNAHKLIAQKS